MCTVKMDKILEVDRANLTMLVEPGVTTIQIADEAVKAGLFYPPDPGSMKISTIGGNVAENSGGLRGLKYGVTRNYVMGMEVVLPNGDVTFLGNKCVKDVAGYSLKDVFIGSEGTLGVITKVLLKLIPKPQTKKTMVATYAKMDAAAETVSAIIAAQIIPCTLEFLDRTTIHCVEDYAKIGLPLDCEALLLMETDGHPAVVAEEAAAMERIAREHGCLEVRVAKDDAEATKLASARRSAFSALARVAPTTILEDATVPRSELAHMIRFVEADREEISTEDRHVRPHGRRQSAPDLSHRRTQQGRNAPRRGSVRGNLRRSHSPRRNDHRRTRHWRGEEKFSAEICRRSADARDARTAPRAGSEWHFESGEDV